MTAPTPAPAGLDELDALLTAALSVRNNYPSSPKLEALHDDGESQVILAWSDGATADFVETFDAETADLIAVTINRAPAMLAAIRAAYTLAKDLEQFGSDRDRDNEDDDEAQAASAAAYLRSAHLLREALGAAK